MVGTSGNPDTAKAGLMAAPEEPDPAPAVHAWLYLARAWEGVAGARDVGDVANTVRATGRAITGADGVTFVMRDGDACHYMAEDAISPLWSGKRFPMSACISGWCMQHNLPVIIPDIYADIRIPAEAYRPTFVASLAMVPLGGPGPLAAIGAYWARPHIASSGEMLLLEQLARFAASGLARIERNKRKEESEPAAHPDLPAG